MRRDFDIEPLIGVPPVLLGMSQEAARTAMAAPYDTYDKVDGSGCFVDAYFQSAFQVFFAAANSTVESIELSNDPGLCVRFRGLDVFAIPADELVAVISEITRCDETHPEHGYSFFFPSLELWLWRPDLTQAFFETIGVAVAGYGKRAV